MGPGNLNPTLLLRAPFHYLCPHAARFGWETDPTEMPSSGTCVAKGPIPHRGVVTWMGGAPESSPMYVQASRGGMTWVARSCSAASEEKKTIPQTCQAHQG